MSEKETSKNQKEETDGIGVGFLRKGVLIGSLFVLALVGIWSVIQIYVNISSAIELWISDEYVDIFQAGFNLVILLLISICIVRLLRRYEVNL